MIDRNNKMGDMQWFNRAIVILLILALVGCIGILASVPPVSRDALTHHLAIPKLYLSSGRIFEIPDAIASYFPMNIDLLYIIPLMLGNDIAAKYIHFGFALLTAGLIYAYVCRRLGRIYGCIGILLFLSLPIIIKLSITVYVDLGLLFLSFGAILTLIKWKDSNFKMGYLLLSATLCGLSMGTKYNGIVVCIILTFFAGYIYSRGSIILYRKNNLVEINRKAFLSSALYACVATIVFSPWAFRNWYWTGNPVYPLFDTLFNPDNPFVETTLKPFVIRKLVYQEGWRDILTVPLRIFFEGQDNVPALFDGRLNPYLLILPIFGILTLRKFSNNQVRAEKNLFAFFSILFIAIVFFTRDMRIRYIAPIIPPLIVLAVYGVYNLAVIIKKIDHPLVRHMTWGGGVVIGVLFLVPNGMYLIDQFKVVRPISYISGKISRDQYIEMYRPEYAVIKFSNTHLPEDAKILCLFVGNRRYYFDRQTIFDGDRFKTIVRESPTADEITRTIVKMDITHIIVGMDLFQEWSINTFSDMEYNRITLFFQKYMENIKSKGNYVLYKIKRVEN